MHYFKREDGSQPSPHVDFLGERALAGVANSQGHLDAVVLFELQNLGVAVKFSLLLSICDYEELRWSN